MKKKNNENGYDTIVHTFVNDIKNYLFRNKISGFAMLEVVISIFFLSLIILISFRSIFTYNNLLRKNEIKEEMINIAETNIEYTLAGIAPPNYDEKYTVVLNTESVENLTKIHVVVSSNETGEKIEFISYK